MISSYRDNPSSQSPDLARIPVLPPRPQLSLSKYMAFKLNDTEYKIRYKEECANCEIKDLCGGFFFSTMHFEDITVRPIVGALKSDEK